ncbi:hypothetical protein [Geofilum rubicundum]|uniref:Transcription-repair coupling factor n=1 Tax=Geofilum rubicundum JCM 15548 TaxID=1236989 RepID=A0A0E9M1F3_9BACT|nr:hypothetical protein [Geofilum rubicundum]GAO30975.1 transcription-repair coupling factor [Geofilum rubicundum JCM 15548]
MSSTPAPAQKYLQHPQISIIQDWLLKPDAPIHIKGLSGSSPALLITALKENHPHLFVAADKESAAYLYHDLIQINDESDVFFLPSSYKRSPEFGQPESSQLILRTEALQQLRQAKAQQFFITYTEALLEKVPGGSVIEEQTLTIGINERIDLFFVVDFLKELGFQKADFVYEPGYYSVRGSILDIYSFSHEEPFRIDFFGDEIESIRSFDIENQLSKSSFDEITIIPELVATGSADYLPLTQSITNDIVIWMDSPALVQSRMNAIFEKVTERFDAGKAEEVLELKIPEPGQLVDGDQLMQHLSDKPLVILNSSQASPLLKPFRLTLPHNPCFTKTSTWWKPIFWSDSRRVIKSSFYRITIASWNACVKYLKIAGPKSATRSSSMLCMKLCRP